jgi:RNA polymerase sigma-70 factor (ECF subfamily)
MSGVVESPSPVASALAQRIVDGDDRAFEETYQLYGAMVRNYLRRYVGRDEADDVLQIVFLEVWRTRHRIDPCRPLEAWLFGIARKRAIDQLRSKRHEVVPVDAMRELMGEDGDQFVERMAWAAEVRVALDRLPTDQQQAIELSYFGDRSQQQIATELGVPLGTVKARMARGMHRLTATMLRGEEG